MPDPAPTPITANWNSQTGWSISPPGSDVPAQGTAKFIAADKDCTFCFNPTNTIFGTSLDVNKGNPASIPVGANNFTVEVCAADKGSTCSPTSSPREVVYTIKVGSGSVGGRGK